MPILSHSENNQGLDNQLLIVNGVFKTTGKHDLVAQAFQQRNNQALERIPESLAQLPRMQVHLKGHNVFGIKALRELFDSDDMSQQGPEAFNGAELTEGVPAQAIHGLGVRCSVAAHPPTWEAEAESLPLFDPVAQPEPDFQFDQTQGW